MQDPFVGTAGEGGGEKITSPSSIRQEAKKSSGNPGSTLLLGCIQEPAWVFVFAFLDAMWNIEHCAQALIPITNKSLPEDLEVELSFVKFWRKIFARSHGSIFAPAGP